MYTTSLSAQNQSRIPEIDGLRGIAILSVVVAHWIILPLSHSIEYPVQLAHILNFFGYGVDLFFVISGFLIGGILLNSEKKASSVIAFYVKRILRIWPLYYLLLGLAYFIGGAQVFKIPYWTYFVFLFNFWEAKRFSFHFAFATLWSLAVEEQFYALAPLMFLLIKPKSLMQLAIFFILASPILRLVLTLNTNLNLWRFSLTRLDGISMGVLLAIVLSSSDTMNWLIAKIKTLRVVTFMLFAVTLFFRLALPIPLWDALGISVVDLSFASLLTTVIAQSRTNQKIRILNSTVLCYFGIRCYSIYLFHLFFEILAAMISKNFLFAFLLQSVFTLAFAHAAWKYIESPLIKLGRRFSY